MKHFFIVLQATLYLFLTQAVYGQTAKDSATGVLYRISTAYQKGLLPESNFLDTVPYTMRKLLSENVIFTNKELLKMLTVYRTAIWRDKKYEARKRDYYAILSNQAQMGDRNGEMLYYAGKFDQLERETKNRKSLTALSVVAIYYDGQRANEKLAELYKKEKNYLEGIPGIVDKDQLSVSDLVQATITLELMARALYELNDTIAGAQAETTLGKIAVIAKEKAKGAPDVIARVNATRIFSFYRRGVAKNDPRLMQEAFRRMDEFVADGNTPEYMKPNMAIAAADAKTAYYIHYARIDSAAYYLERYQEFMKGNQNLYNRFVEKKYKARLLYTEKKYKESADLYETAMSMLDSSRTLISRDIDDMMYARAESEEQQLLLAEAELQNRIAEKKLLIGGATGSILLVCAFFFVRQLRRRQKDKLLEFKFNMARNIHDETNPALLYASALAKASRSTERGVIASTELEQHIGHIMELMRSLSHDLKSDKQYVLHDLVATMKQTLVKLNVSGDFSFDIQAGPGMKRFISHYQFSQLRSILNECITNSIKHASFDKIDLVFTSKGNRLVITYRDNGAGWPPSLQAAGIGIDNMKDRVRQLNGELEIANDYPNGYRITVSCLLR